ncbi:hypothetical protein MMMDOFMJ_2514 [Methylobacterium gnaphalii]|uniref:Uncharacterized protein n=1 Tax=Methylobacterium gnaphalii TaxID=1010610 RepID=A0A512JNT2_9HYPH|nr:hypothetical protein MGN01_34650 [Methylobacterium gnaphalii]GJD69577.1 hypothetical protein MMMDOFMJ_2514 [Methylobacterium gnaphalii]GLS49117.1 hypothetical protein GCM10007885_19650 [Methylobacterium gnaphalii]
MRVRSNRTSFEADGWLNWVDCVERAEPQRVRDLIDPAAIGSTVMPGAPCIAQQALFQRIGVRPYAHHPRFARAKRFAEPSELSWLYSAIMGS